MLLFLNYVLEANSIVNFTIDGFFSQYVTDMKDKNFEITGYVHFGYDFNLTDSIWWAKTASCKAWHGQNIPMGSWDDGEPDLDKEFCLNYRVQSQLFQDRECNKPQTAICMKAEFDLTEG